MSKLHLFLCLMICLFSLLMTITKNPVESVLFLIMSFCVSTFQLFIFNADFFGLMFIIIYVGAIAVLFLFVIMMINIKDKIAQRTKTNLEFFSYLMLFVAIFIFIYLVTPMAIGSDATNVIIDIDIEEIFGFSNFGFLHDLYNLDVVGQVLYTEYLPAVLLAGLILLIALLGAIILTFIFKKNIESQFTDKQLSRLEKFISFFKRKK